MDDPVLAGLNIFTRLHGQIFEIKQKYIKHEEIHDSMRTLLLLLSVTPGIEAESGTVCC